MARVVRLGSPRTPGEGLRLGTVRRPPRGVPKTEFASQNWYDVWFPNLAPSPETMKLGQAAHTPAQWAAFTKKYRAEMATPDNSHAIELLAALSHQCNFSVGCYCENEAHCHRSVLRELLVEKGAKLLEPPEGTEVIVTSLEVAKGSPKVVLAAIDSLPHVEPKDVEEFRGLIEEGKRPVRFANPLARKR